MRYSIITTAWGAFGCVAHGDRLVATYHPQDQRTVRRRIHDDWPDAVEDLHLLHEFQQQVVAYFEGNPVRFKVSLDLAGVSPFRRSVLRQCRRIPYGKTASYRDLARAAGNPAASRAAGSAMARNPLPLVIPCHRVVRSDGSLGGFSSPGSVREKKRLLEFENVDTSLLC